MLKITYASLFLKVVTKEKRKRWNQYSFASGNLNILVYKFSLGFRFSSNKDVSSVTVKDEKKEAYPRSSYTWSIAGKQ